MAFPSSAFATSGCWVRRVARNASQLAIRLHLVTRDPPARVRPAPTAMGCREWKLGRRSASARVLGRRANDSQLSSSDAETGVRVERTTGIEPASSAWKNETLDFSSSAVTCGNVG